MPLPRMERTLELSVPKNLKFLQRKPTAVAQLLFEKETLEDDVAVCLYTKGFLRDDEVILNLNIGDVVKNSRPVRVTFIEEREVKFIKHN